MSDDNRDDDREPFGNSEHFDVPQLISTLDAELAEIKARRQARDERQARFRAVMDQRAVTRALQVGYVDTRPLADVLRLLN